MKPGGECRKSDKRVGKIKQLQFMYKIDKRPSGYILTFSGQIDAIEMQRWLDDSKRNLDLETTNEFGVIINMKDLQPLKPDAGAIMKDGQKLYKAKGMNRSAVILNSAEICSQFKNIAIQTGIYAKERFIDASVIPNPIDAAVAWVKDAIDPDK
jgi:hypothetical protein